MARSPLSLWPTSIAWICFFFSATSFSRFLSFSSTTSSCRIGWSKWHKRERPKTKFSAICSPFAWKLSNTNCDVLHMAPIYRIWVRPTSLFFMLSTFPHILSKLFIEKKHFAAKKHSDPAHFTMTPALKWKDRWAVRTEKQHHGFASCNVGKICAHAEKLLGSPLILYRIIWWHIENEWKG